MPEEGIQPAPSPAANGAADRDGKVVIFRRVSLPWAQWVDWWRHDRAGEPLPPPFPVLPVTLNGPNEAARNPGESSTAFRAGEPTAPRPENSL